MAIGSIVTKYINIPVFIISFAFGIFAVYTTLPDVKKIIVYPSPENVSHIQYKDKANQCFRFEEKKISCPKKSSDIFKIPAQT
jgi:hypothetical protein